MNKTTLGLAGVLGIWFCNGVALPLVKHLPLTTQQLMTARGLLTAAITAMLIRTKIRAGTGMFVLGLTFAFACVGLYNGVKAWGPVLTIIVLTATPLFNFLFSRLAGRKVPHAAGISLFFMLAGIAVALGIWKWHTFSVEGFFWSAFGAFMNALYYEAMKRTSPTEGMTAEETHALQFTRCFWQACMVFTVGILGSANASWQPVLVNSSLQLSLLMFALLAGFFYFMSNLWAFDNLPKDVASVLAQGETPAVILMSWVILGERLSIAQWTGVFIALCAACYLSAWTAKQEGR